MKLASSLPEIVRLISTHPVLEVIGPLSEGKTLLIPAALAAVGSQCYVVVPTDAETVALSEQQKILQRAGSHIVYLTAESARKKMLSHFLQGNIDFCEVLIVDAFRCATPDTGAIVSLWSKAAQSGITVPRLVIASSGAVGLQLKVFRFTVTGPTPTTHYYPTHVNMEDWYGTMMEKTAQRVGEIHRSNPVQTGHILVFVPGNSDLHSVIHGIETVLGDDTTHVIVSHQDVALLYSKVADNMRKIIVATDRADMLLEKVGHVVDTMLERYSDNSYPSLISHPSSTQRATYASSANYYPMISESQYRKLKAEVPIHSDYHHIIMDFLAAGLVPELTLKECDKREVSSAVNVVSKLAMVRGTQVTDIGHFANNFPLRVQNSAVVWHWIQKGHPIFPGLVVAVVIQCYGPSYYRLHEYKYEKFSRIVGGDDLETALNLWEALTQNFRGIPSVTDPKLAQWTRACSYHHKKICEVLLTLEASMNALKSLGHTVVVGPFTVSNVVKAARPILKEVYADSVLTRQNKGWYRSDTSHTYRLDTREAVNTLCVTGPSEIIAIATVEIRTSKSLLRVVTFAVKTIDDTTRSRNSAPIWAKPEVLSVSPSCQSGIPT